MEPPNKVHHISLTFFCHTFIPGTSTLNTGHAHTPCMSMYVWVALGTFQESFTDVFQDLKNWPAISLERPQSMEP